MPRCGFHRSVESVDFPWKSAPELVRLLILQERDAISCQMFWLSQSRFGLSINFDDQITTFSIFRWTMLCSSVGGVLVPSLKPLDWGNVLLPCDFERWHHFLFKSVTMNTIEHYWRHHYTSTMNSIHIHIHILIRYTYTCTYTYMCTYIHTWMYLDT